MQLLEIGEAVVYALGIASTLGLPPVLTLYHRAFRRQMAFSPALAYAYTYLDSYVVPLHARLTSGRPLRVDGVAIERVYLRMPGRLADVAGGGGGAEGGGGPYKEAVVDTPAGKRTVRVKPYGEERIAFDVPRILAALEPVIADHLGESRARASARWERVERREVQTFCRQLRALIKARGLQDRVRVFDCTVAELTPETDDLEAGIRPPWRARARRWAKARLVPRRA